MPRHRGRVIAFCPAAELVRFDCHCRNVRIAGRRTSLRLEAPVWEALAEIASTEDRAVDDIVTEIECHRRPTVALASAVRVFTLGWFRRRALMALAHGRTGRSQRAIG